MGEKINSYKDLRVFQNAMNTAMTIFYVTKDFPSEEKYSMVDQIRLHLALFVQTRPKHGESGVTRLHSLPS